MAATKRSRKFKDISFSFNPHPVTKDLSVLSNERAISRSVRNIVETIPSERFFNPFIGSDVRKSFFEYVDYGSASAIEDQIITAIQNFESRVTNIKVQVEPRPDDNNFEVNVFYDIIGQDFVPQQFTFLLEATR